MTKKPKSSLTDTNEWMKYPFAINFKTAEVTLPKLDQNNPMQVWIVTCLTLIDLYNKSIDKFLDDGKVKPKPKKPLKVIFRDYEGLYFVSEEETKEFMGDFYQSFPLHDDSLEKTLPSVDRYVGSLLKGVVLEYYRLAVSGKKDKGKGLLQIALKDKMWTTLDVNHIYRKFGAFFLTLANKLILGRIGDNPLKNMFENALQHSKINFIPSWETFWKANKSIKVLRLDEFSKVASSTEASMIKRALALNESDTEFLAFLKKRWERNDWNVLKEIKKRNDKIRTSLGEEALTTILSRIAWRNNQAKLRDVKAAAAKSGGDVFKASYSFWLNLAFEKGALELFDAAVLTLYVNLPPSSSTGRKQKLIVPSLAKYDAKNRTWSYDTSRLINEYELEVTRLPKSDIRCVESNVKIIRSRINDAAVYHCESLKKVGT
jgi:hypothetical protein